MLGILAWKFILWKLFMALPIFPLDFLHQPFPYILLSNFWISQFTCCFAPPHPALPHRFSSLPRPAPYRTSLGFFASHQPLILQNHLIIFINRFFRIIRFPKITGFPKITEFTMITKLNRIVSLIEWAASPVSQLSQILCISNNCSTKRLKFLFGTENIFD